MICSGLPVRLSPHRANSEFPYVTTVGNPPLSESPRLWALGLPEMSEVTHSSLSVQNYFTA
jgi:hypothetical protein